MRQVSFARAAVLGMATLALASSGCGNDKPADDKRPLTIWWFQWAPATGLQELAAEYTKATGVEVKVAQIPLDHYQTDTFLEFSNATASHPTAFDIVIGDSQWIGRGATQGHYVELTEWLKGVIDLKSIHDHAAKYLCEYPEGSGKWFAAPCETDAVGLAYRKDWFDDAKEKAAFQAKFNRELAVPKTWDEFRQVAEFFQRPDQNRFGCAFTTDRGYDALTMGFQNLLWSFGGMWHAPDSNQVKGFLDTKETGEAVDFFKSLVALGPKGASKLNYGDPSDYFMNGSTAMIVNYFAFFPDLAAKMGDKAGFAVVPAGPKGRAPSLGGQGFSISSKIAPARQELAKKFIAWFLKTETQKEWIKKPGGFTADTAILKSAEFRAASPYNAPFADSVDVMRDFWNVPCFNELLAETQKYIGNAIDGAMPTMDALHALADAKERILKENGLLK